MQLVFTIAVGSQWGCITSLNSIQQRGKGTLITCVYFTWSSQDEQQMVSRRIYFAVLASAITIIILQPTAGLFWLHMSVNVAKAHVKYQMKGLILLLCYLTTSELIAFVANQCPQQGFRFTSFKRIKVFKQLKLMITVITWQCAGGILFVSAAVDKRDIHNESKKKLMFRKRIYVPIFSYC